LLDTPEDRFNAQIDLNLKAVWAGAVAAARRMEAGSAIVNISSGSSIGPRIANGPYSAAKAAVNSLTATLAYELAPRIRVNAVAPGPVLTPNFRDSAKIKDGEEEAFLKNKMNVPTGRWGTPQDVAAAVVYLASPAAQWVMGQVFFITGGRL
jgi:7-alpha-hydroxysteroid dehydrogenase